ncbi:unnamed protein product [Macrosiphum euphorbiae]|uniref:Uncharacterized protein n=1 Tax=Macrosiphum euphorbiae TaxID=13131 RepID=A0AAV0X3A7_9HEMI|nr:unnamed protein product [Macrosiphum euphorbiae]
MLWCAGDDLYGAVGGGRWSSGSRRSRCRCPSNDDDAPSGTCCRFLALTMWSCVRARGVHVYTCDRAGYLYRLYIGRATCACPHGLVSVVGGEVGWNYEKQKKRRKSYNEIEISSGGYEERAYDRGGGGYGVHPTGI